MAPLTRVGAALVLALACGPAWAKSMMSLRPVGLVEVRAPGESEFKPIQQPVAVEPGTRVRTGEGMAELLMPDGSRLVLAKQTEFEIKEASTRSTLFGLTRGRLRGAIAGLFTSKMRIRTPTAVAAVRGTEFDISAAPEGDRFDVADGVLEVEDKSERKAVVTSEESLKVDERGLGVPEPFGLGDDRAQEAARPYVVRQEAARDATKSLMEELRNRELKANEKQLGKSVIDVHGNRVRLEEFLLRPDPKSFKFVFMSFRKEQNRLDWGHTILAFKKPLPDDLSNVQAIVGQTFLSKDPPSNWLTSAEKFYTNTIDSFKKSSSLDDPVQQDFTGLTGTTGDLRWYPRKIVTEEFLSGPGVPGTGPDGFLKLNSLTTVLGADAGVANSATGFLTWTQKIIDNTRTLKTFINARIKTDDYDPTDADPEGDTFHWGGFLFVDLQGDPTIDPIVADTTFPDGRDFAHTRDSTIYRDGTALTFDIYLVSNDGKILPRPKKGGLLAAEDFNFEFTIASNRFEGRTIDLLKSPAIDTLTSGAGKTPNELSP